MYLANSNPYKTACVLTIYADPIVFFLSFVTVFFNLGMMGYFNYSGRHRRMQQLAKVTLLETLYLHILQNVMKFQ